MNAVGYMTMPDKFYYMDVFLQGKPQHDRYDRFSIKHPPMDVGKRAKIFSPFDALKGFNEAVAAKEVPYVNRIELTEEDKKAKESGELVFSYGSSEVEIVKVQSLSWKKDSLHHNMMQMDGKLSQRELVEMATEVIKQ